MVAFASLRLRPIHAKNRSTNPDGFSEPKVHRPARPGMFENVGNVVSRFYGGCPALARPSRDTRMPAADTHAAGTVSNHLTVFLRLTLTEQTFGADADHGSTLAQRWCASCHVVSSSQRRANRASVKAIGGSGNLNHPDDDQPLLRICAAGAWVKARAIPGEGTVSAARLPASRRVARS